MSEGEPLSTIFVSKSDESTLGPVWPKHSFDDLPGRQASQIRRESEVYGVFHVRGKHEGFGFHAKDGKDFNIETESWEEQNYTPEFYERLAREVEKQVGKKGITVILY